MALDHRTKVFAIKEMKIAKMTADPPGGSATYAASVPLPGAKALAITGNIDSKKLRGDNTLLDADAIWNDLHAAISHAKLNYDALAVMFSTLAVDSGTTPNQLVTLGMKNTDTLNYFKLEGRAASADPVAGDILFSLWKCKLAAFPTMGLNEEDYQLSGFEVNILPRLADSLWLSPVLRETAVVLG